MNEEEEFEFRLRLEQEQAQPAVEPSLMDEIQSYGASALSGITALPRGAAQLGANIGDVANQWADEEFGGGGIELTEGAKSSAMDAGIPVPEDYEQYGFGDAVNATIAKQQAVKDALMEKGGREGFDWTELAGMVGSPASLMKTGIAKGATLPAKVVEGTKVGATYGAGMPVTSEGDYGKKKVEQALISGGISGGVPLAAAPLKAVGGAIDQFTRPMGFRNKAGKVADYAKGKMSGIQRDIQEIANDMFGGNRDKVIKALADAKPSPISGNPTAGQAVAKAQSPETRFGNPLLKLESEVAKRPETSDVVNALYRKQQAGRAGALDKLAGTPEDMTKAVTARSEATRPLYKATEESTARVDSKPVIGMIDDIMSKNKNNDKVMKPLIDARKKLMTDDKAEYSPIALKSLSDDLSNKINAKNPQTGVNEFDVASLTKVKAQLDQQIKRDVPEFGLAKKAHAKMSEPINQMQVAQAVKDKIGVDIGDESIKPFLKAMNDQAKLIKQATGFKRGKELESIYKGNPEALKQLKTVVDDLEVNLEAGKMTREVGSVFGDVKTGVEPRIPGMLERGVVLANALLSKITKDKTGEYAKELARLVANPNEFAALLNAPKSDPLVQNAMAVLNQISKAAPMSAAKAVGEQ